MKTELLNRSHLVIGVGVMNVDAGDFHRHVLEDTSLSLSSVVEVHDEFVESPYPDFTQLTIVHAAFVSVYVLVILLSVIGNALVCLTVFRNKKMHTAVNYYIVNLGLCDLMVGLFVMPVKLLELAAPAHWDHMNDALCTATMYLQTVVVFGGVLTLVATCVERYFAIVHPFKSRMHHSKSRTKCILLAVWIAPCLVASPFLYPASAQENWLRSEYGVVHRLTCFDGFSEYFRRVYFMMLFLLVFVLPLIFIGGTCFAIFRVLLGGIPFHRQGSLRRQENNRHKVAKMVMVVAVAYAVSWTPYFTVTLISQLQSDSFLHRGQYLFTMLSINLFAFANSCVNPFIYAAMSVRFRHGFRSIFLLLMCSSHRSEEEVDGVALSSKSIEGVPVGRHYYMTSKTRPGPSSSSDTPQSSSKRLPEGGGQQGKAPEITQALSPAPNNNNLKSEIILLQQRNSQISTPLRKVTMEDEQPRLNSIWSRCSTSVVLVKNNLNSLFSFTITCRANIPEVGKL